MLEVAVWSIHPVIREMGMPDEAISSATEHALICSQELPLAFAISYNSGIVYINGETDREHAACKGWSYRLGI